MTNQKTITVSIIGYPNAGKSTLLNSIIGQKISIVTPKVQTTRTVIDGILTINNTQMIFCDTPGIFRDPGKTLEKSIVKTAWSNLENTDLVLVIIDATRKLDEDLESILNNLNTKYKKIQKAIILNKLDLISKDKQQEIEGLYKNFADKIFKISALKGEGIEGLLAWVEEVAPVFPWIHAEDDLTTIPIKLLASEITREKIFLKLSKELPYEINVETESWKEKDGKIEIHQSIFVKKESQKMIVIGDKGSMIKAIGIEARKEIEELAGAKVNLQLFVKIRKNWTENPEAYKYLRMEQG